MFYVVSKTGVTSGKNIKEINRKCDAVFDVDEFRGCGTDFIIQVDVPDLSFVQDKKRLSQIPMRNLYKKDSIIIFVILNLIMTFFCLVRGG